MYIFRSNLKTYNPSISSKPLGDAEAAWLPKKYIDENVDTQIEMRESKSLQISSYYLGLSVY